MGGEEILHFYVYRENRNGDIFGKIRELEV